MLRVLLLVCCAFLAALTAFVMPNSDRDRNQSIALTPAKPEQRALSDLADTRREQLAAMKLVEIETNQGKVTREISDVLPRLDVDLRPSYPLDLNDFPDDYDELEIMAEGGNANAAFVLSKKLQNCLSAPPPQSEDELNQSISDIQTLYRIPYYRDDDLAYVDIDTSRPDAIDEAVAFYARRFRDCNRYTVRQRKSHGSWLRKSIELDNPPPEAIRTHVTSLPFEEATIVAQSGWKKGNAEYLMVIAALERRGFRSGRSLDGNVDSAAAIFAYAMIVSEAIWRGDKSPDKNKWHSRAAGYLESLTPLTASLSPDQIDLALLRARALVHDNSACCSLRIVTPGATRPGT